MVILLYKKLFDLFLVGDNPLNNLMLAFIIMGYIYVLYPIFLVICLCLCLPFLILLIYFLGGTSQKPAENVKFILKK